MGLFGGIAGAVVVFLAVFCGIKKRNMRYLASKHDDRWVDGLLLGTMCYPRDFLLDQPGSFAKDIWPSCVPLRWICFKGSRLDRWERGWVNEVSFLFLRCPSKLGRAGLNKLLLLRFSLALGSY